MDWLTVSLGVTGSFFQALLLQTRCVPDYELFDGCLDATEYVPMGCMSDVNGSPVINSTFGR
jgi:hypothetical protein